MKQLKRGTGDSRRQSTAGRAKSGKSAGHGSKSPAVREAAILALLTEKSIRAAAEKAGVGERTLQTWLAEDEAFKAEYTAARQVTYQAGIARVMAITGKAIDKLESLLEAESETVQLGAARTVAEIGMHQADAESILRKLDEIEGFQRQQGRA